MEDKISQTKDSLNNLLNIYMAKISLEMNQLSNQVNSVMKTFRFVRLENSLIFSAVATIFLPLSFVASLVNNLINALTPSLE